MTKETEDVKAWLTAIDKDRLWLAEQLRATKGSVDQWFSKGFPDWALQIISLLKVSLARDSGLQLQFNVQEWELIQRAMLRAGYTDHFAFFRDGIIAFAQELERKSKGKLVALTTLAEEDQQYGKAVDHFNKVAKEAGIDLKAKSPKKRTKTKR